MEPYNVLNMCNANTLQDMFLTVVFLFMCIQVSAYIILVLSYLFQVEEHYVSWAVPIYICLMLIMSYDILFYQVDVVSVLIILVLIYVGKASMSAIIPGTFDMNNIKNMFRGDYYTLIISITLALFSGTILSIIGNEMYSNLNMNALFQNTEYIFKYEVLDMILVVSSILIVCFLYYAVKYDYEPKNIHVILIVIASIVFMIYMYNKYSSVCGF